jgi:hypothetical protein
MDFRQIPSLPASPRKHVSRALAVVLLGLQALLWGGGSIAEARTAAESFLRYSHIEDQASTACPPLHSHLDCLICRTFSSGATSGSAPSLVAIATDGDERPSVVDVASGHHGRSGSLGSRAPPSA